MATIAITPDQNVIEAEIFRGCASRVRLPGPDRPHPDAALVGTERHVIGHPKRSRLSPGR